jgi:hypothetical protein
MIKKMTVRRSTIPSEYNAFLYRATIDKMCGLVRYRQILDSIADIAKIDVLGVDLFE